MIGFNELEGADPDFREGALFLVNLVKMKP